METIVAALPEVAGKPDADVALAAFALAHRITGSEARALDAVGAAASRVNGAELLREVRIEARARRGTARPAAVARPAGLEGIAADDWDVVERVALRGEMIVEVATELGVAAGVVALRLHRGLRAVRVALEKGRQANVEPRAAARPPRRRVLSAERGHDAAHDRQPKAAARACVAL
jgi:hypothetical protein